MCASFSARFAVAMAPKGSTSRGKKPIVVMSPLEPMSQTSLSLLAHDTAISLADGLIASAKRPPPASDPCVPKRRSSAASRSRAPRPPKAPKASDDESAGGTQPDLRQDESGRGRGRGRDGGRGRGGRVPRGRHEDDAATAATTAEKAEAKSKQAKVKVTKAVKKAEPSMKVGANTATSGNSVGGCSGPDPDACEPGNFPNKQKQQLLVTMFQKSASGMSTSPQPHKLALLSLLDKSPNTPQQPQPPLSSSSPCIAQTAQPTARRLFGKSPGTGNVPGYGDSQASDPVDTSTAPLPGVEDEDDQEPTPNRDDLDSDMDKETLKLGGSPMECMCGDSVCPACALGKPSISASVTAPQQSNQIPALSSPTSAGVGQAWQPQHVCHTFPSPGDASPEFVSKLKGVKTHTRHNDFLKWREDLIGDAETAATCLFGDLAGEPFEDLKDWERWVHTTAPELLLLLPECAEPIREPAAIPETSPTSPRPTTPTAKVAIPKDDEEDEVDTSARKMRRLTPPNSWTTSPPAATTAAPPAPPPATTVNAWTTTPSPAFLRMIRTFPTPNSTCSDGSFDYFTEEDFARQDESQRKKRLLAADTANVEAGTVATATGGPAALSAQPSHPVSVADETSGAGAHPGGNTHCDAGETIAQALVAAAAAAAAASKQDPRQFVPPVGWDVGQLPDPPSISTLGEVMSYMA